ncbi:hypothetical protein [Acidipila sp. EB88]|uniref:hypothetical protein n=1 Tax=Acidipila sp. EB88 TaxID=2305226 RepID=UPI000F6024DE|nr:hypothetical protein [Acidipila sp. EB88]RRA49107.1 hypothetical protein D1Y84_13295 [Acidipila sp. EB88]
MRKQVTGHDATAESPGNAQENWLPLETLATAEVSSEAAGYPVENALVPGAAGYWQAASTGAATITLRFDAPQSVRRVLLQVEDAGHERSQEWAITASFADGTRRELLRQGWNFSPGGSTQQVEEYTFDLHQVSGLTLWIDPDRGRDRYPAVLSAWRVSGA